MRKFASVGVVAALGAVALLGATAGAPAATCEECVSPLVALADLHAAVDELVPEQGLANSLDAKVEAATAAVTAGRYTPALNQMDAFENELDAQTAAGRVYTSVSNIMKTKHDTVKNSISNVR